MSLEDFQYNHLVCINLHMYIETKNPQGFPENLGNPLSMPLKLISNHYTCAYVAMHINHIELVNMNVIYANIESLFIQ